MPERYNGARKDESPILFRMDVQVDDWIGGDGGSWAARSGPWIITGESHGVVATERYDTVAEAVEAFGTLPRRLDSVA
jgi:hypothetical protein